MEASQKARVWLESGYLLRDEKDLIEKNLENPIWVENHFGKELDFGTGGLRGIVGIGTSHMNIYNIRKYTFGLAQAAKRAENKRVVIGYDSRLSSLSFAQAAAAVLCQQNFEVFMFSHPVATPIVSFAIRDLKACAGINITASHNPPEYNGYKVYWANGAQVTAPNDQEIVKFSLFASNFKEFMEGTFDEKKIKKVSQETLDRYFEQIYQKIPETWREARGADFIYSPLHGVGKLWAESYFKKFQKDIKVQFVDEQKEPDGKFPTVKQANPEDVSALQIMSEKMVAKNIRYGFATDPDADRLAIIEKLPDGSMVYFTGNQVGALFTYFYLSALKEEGKIPEKAFVVRTIVSSNLIDKIAKDFQVEVKTCLTGFKYIAKEIEWYQESCLQKFLFGTEESIGYLFGDSVRDKDGIQALVMGINLVNYLHSQNLTLKEGLEKIYSKYGYHQETLKNLNLKEYDLNVQDMEAKMENLRTNYPNTLAGFTVEKINDYQKSARFNPGQIRNYEEIKMPMSNVIIFELAENFTIAIRPSGTEPKVKIYAMGSLKEVGSKTDQSNLGEKIKQIEQSLVERYLNGA